MSFPITATYAIGLAVLMLILCVRVIMLRASTGISILHGDNITLAERTRQHGNFAENAPMGLILLGLAEAGGGGVLWLHAAGLLLLAGRVVHPFGISAGKADLPARIAGQAATLTAIALLAGLLAYQRFWA